MRPRLSLATQILALQVLIVLVTVAVSAAVGVQQTRAQLTRQEGAKVLAIAQSVAALPEVRAAFDDPDPSRVLQPLAESVRTASDLTFVVLADRDQVRLAHPDPALDRPAAVDRRDRRADRPRGRDDRARHARPRACARRCRCATPPARSSASSPSAASRSASPSSGADALPRLLLYLLLALAAGAFGSWLLARRLKRQTFGLEPEEIAPAARAARGDAARHPRGAARRRRQRPAHARQRRGAHAAATCPRAAPAGSSTSCRPAAAAARRADRHAPRARTRSCCGQAGCWC